jgi:hypothetical protein
MSMEYPKSFLIQCINIFHYSKDFLKTCSWLKNENLWNFCYVHLYIIIYTSLFWVIKIKTIKSQIDHDFKHIVWNILISRTHLGHNPKGS